MKILYVTGATNIDVMNDTIFHGLYSMFGDAVVDSNKLWYMYDQPISWGRKKRLYGRGFTIPRTLPHDLADRTDLESKIKNNYFEYIIYGQIQRCDDYLEMVLDNYPLNKIVFIDGEDSLVTRGNLFMDQFIYFKREIGSIRKNMFPISFSFPKEKINKDIESIVKDQKFGYQVPGDRTTYKFKREKSYYKDYQRSYFGKTWKKAGWDCLRHYEVMANYCMPYFPGIEQCPENIMVNFPKRIVKEGNKLAEQDMFDESKYFTLLDELFDYFISHMTTEHAAKYLLNTVKSAA